MKRYLYILVFAGLIGGGSLENGPLTLTDTQPAHAATPAGGDVASDEAVCEAACEKDAGCVQTCVATAKKMVKMLAMRSRGGGDASSESYPGAKVFRMVTKKVCKRGAGSDCAERFTQHVKSLRQAPDKFFGGHIRYQRECIAIAPFQAHDHAIEKVLKRHKRVERIKEKCDTILSDQWATLARRGVSRLGPKGNGKPPSDWEFVPSKAEGEKLVAELLKKAPEALKMAEAELKVIADAGLVEKALQVQRSKSQHSKKKKGMSEAIKDCCRGCGGTIVGEACSNYNFECWNRNACGTL